jgi:hypothetical protein
MSGMTLDTSAARAAGIGEAREPLAGELGDVRRYSSRLRAASGVGPAELLARNRAKIEVRLARAG